MQPVTNILVPFDWSDLSRHAFAVAVSLAREHDARLLVLYAVPLPTLMYGPAPENYLDHLVEELHRLEPCAPKLRVEYRLLEGDPAAAILGTARECRCDLIVMGTHGRTGLKRLLMGSVAAKVAAKAPCPVLTVGSRVPETVVG